MIYTCHYNSLLGNLLLTADEKGLIGVLFDSEGNSSDKLPVEHLEKDNLPALAESRHWLDIYFSGKEPNFTPKLHPIGSAFRQLVWDILLQIPYGKTMTYGEIAKQIARSQGIARMSAQAVGGAVGHNNSAIIVPCHRVIGTNGSLVGYGGGLDKKRLLLELEHIEMTGFK